MNNMDDAEDARSGPISGVDLQAALAMAGGDIHLLRDLVRAFLDEVPRLLDTLRRAVAQREAQSVQAAAHKLQGVMRCLHFDRALHQTRTLEFLAEGEADWPALEATETELKTTIDTAMDALSQFLDGNT